MHLLAVLLQPSHRTTLDALWLHHAVFSTARRMVEPAARGVVSEIDIGSGHNLDFYDFMQVETVIGNRSSTLN